MKFPEVDIISDICAECQNVSLLTEIITKIRSVRKELNIKIRRAGNKRAILALIVLLVMIIAVGIALSVIILRS